jgi:flagellar assembly factor FliW
MLIETTRFGRVDIEEERVITFPKGLLGFPRFTRFALLEQGDESYFFWLQSAESPDLAFVVTDPALFFADYQVPLKAEQLAEMGVASPEEAQVMVIVNKHENLLTGNLQGPLVINVATRSGEQVVLSERRFTTRVPLVELPRRVEALSA